MLKSRTLCLCNDQVFSCNIYNSSLYRMGEREGEKKLGGSGVLWSAETHFAVITCSFQQNPLWVSHRVKHPCLIVTFLEEKSLFTFPNYFQTSFLFVFWQTFESICPNEVAFADSKIPCICKISGWMTDLLQGKH